MQWSYIKIATNKFIAQMVQRLNEALAQRNDEGVVELKQTTFT